MVCTPELESGRAVRFRHLRPRDISLSYKVTCKSRATKAFVNDSNKTNLLVLSCGGCTRQWTDVVAETLWLIPHK